ncbi:hypothetical protein QHF89_36210, partial [Polyangium sorediatum]|nr:hypothetical protein [Polyangium sorediatum]
MIGTTGLPGSAFKGDTSLRLCNFLDKQVAYNDDAACNLNTGSLISFTSPYGVSQDFVLWVGCIDTPCGPNAVRIARRDPVVFSYAFQDANSTAEQTYTLEASQNIRNTSPTPVWTPPRPRGRRREHAHPGLPPRANGLRQQAPRRRLR